MKKETTVTKPSALSNRALELRLAREAEANRQWAQRKARRRVVIAGLLLSPVSFGAFCVWFSLAYPAPTPTPTPPVVSTPVVNSVPPQEITREQCLKRLRSFEEKVRNGVADRALAKNLHHSVDYCWTLRWENGKENLDTPI